MNRKSAFRALLLVFGAMVLACLVLLPTLSVQKFFFPDNEMLREYADLTKDGTLPFLSLPLKKLYIEDPGGHAKYRPLGNLGYLAKYYLIRNVTPYAGVIIHFVLITLLILSLVWLARLSLGEWRWEVFIAPILYCLSPVFLGQSQLHVVAEDAAVIILSAVVLASYLIARKKENLTFYIISVAAIIFLPLYKEPIIAACLAVVLLEISRRDFKWKRAMVYTFAGFLAQFPVLTAGILLNGTVSRPRFSTNFIHGDQPYWGVGQHLVGQVGPLLILVMILAAIVITVNFKTWNNFFKNLIQDTLISKMIEWLPFKNKINVSVPVSIFLVSILGAVAYIFLGYDPSNFSVHNFGEGFQKSLGDWEQGYMPKSPYQIIGFLLPVGFALLACTGNLANRLIAIWFLGTYVGMAKFYFIDHHLMYALPAFSILVCWYVSRLNISALGLRYKIPIIAALVLVTVQLSSNIFNMTSLLKKIDRSEQEVAAALPSGEITILSNSIISEDIFYRKQEQCRNFSKSTMSTAPACSESPVLLETFYSTLLEQPHIVIRDKHIRNSAQLLGVVERSVKKQSPLYILHNHLGLWRYWILEDPQLQSQAILLSEVTARHTLIAFDPLLHLLPTYFWPKPILPDWYREASVQKSTFGATLQIGLRIYKVDSEQLLKLLLDQQKK